VTSIVAVVTILGLAGASGGPAIRGPSATERCMKSAAEGSASSFSIVIRRMAQAGDVIRLALTFNNLTDSPIWMNLKPFSLEGSGLESDRQLFVTVHAPKEKSGRSTEYDGPPVNHSSYGIIGPHKRHDLVVSVTGIGFDLKPGTYKVDACFWDRSVAIPKPPQGTTLVKGPVGVSQMVTVTP
jgi:hypothetical protein